MNTLLKISIFDMLTHLDNNYLNKLLKIAPEKMKGIPVVSKNTSKQVRQRLFNHLTNKKNLSAIIKFVENGGVHDVLENDIDVYNDIEFNDYQDFFSSLKNQKRVNPYTIYIYLIEKDSSLLENFFVNIEGLHEFTQKAKQYISITSSEKQEESEDKSKIKEKNMLEKISLLEKHIENSKQKIITMEKENKKLKVKLEKKVFEKQKDEKKYEESIKRITLELTKKSDAKIGDFENRISQKEKERLSHQENTLKLNRKIRELNKKIIKLESQNTQINKLEQSNRIKPNKTLIDKSKILLIGNPYTSPLREDIDFHILDQDTEISKIEDTLNENNFEEIWLISFQLQPRQQKKISQRFQENIKIKKIDDLTKLE